MELLLRVLYFAASMSFFLTANVFAADIYQITGIAAKDDPREKIIPYSGDVCPKTRFNEPGEAIVKSVHDSLSTKCLINNLYIRPQETVVIHSCSDGSTKTNHFFEDLKICNKGSSRMSVDEV